MTDADPAGADESIKLAGLDGIGDKWAAHLDAAGITTVRKLAEADIDKLAKKLAKHTKWRAETLRQHLVEWVGLAKERLEKTPPQLRGHVFMVKLWVDSESHPVKSRFVYHSPEEPKSEKESQDKAGWSPLGFARFVQGAVGLVEARDLTEERVESKELVEWSKHSVEGPLVRGGEALALGATIPSEDLIAKDKAVRWRATGTLHRFGDDSTVNLGTCKGRTEPGETIELSFGSRQLPKGLYRAWFDLAVNPPTEVDHLITVAEVEATATG